MDQLLNTVFSNSDKQIDTSTVTLISALNKSFSNFQDKFHELDLKFVNESNKLKEEIRSGDIKTKDDLREVIDEEIENLTEIVSNSSKDLRRLLDESSSTLKELIFSFSNDHKFLEDTNTNLNKEIKEIKSSFDERIKKVETSIYDMDKEVSDFKKFKGLVRWVGITIIGSILVGYSNILFGWITRP